jgi:hypothetical protein
MTEERKKKKERGQEEKNEKESFSKERSLGKGKKKKKKKKKKKREKKKAQKKKKKKKNPGPKLEKKSKTHRTEARPNIETRHSSDTNDINPPAPLFRSPLHIAARWPLAFFFFFFSPFCFSCGARNSSFLFWIFGSLGVWEFQFEHLRRL